MFFTVLIILIVLILVGNYVYHYYSNERAASQEAWPPVNYMTEIGAQCPEMWVINPQGDTVTCSNNFAMPGPTSAGPWPAVTEWPVSKKNNKTVLQPRCSWLQNNREVSWNGVLQACH